MASASNSVGPQPVAYIFQLQGMEPRARYDTRRDSRDRWLPPKKKRSNRLHIMEGQEIPLKMTFYHNGTSTFLLNAQQLEAFRGRVQPFKECSMYHARSVFWTVNYDATTRKVGDGQHENAEDEDDENEDDDSEGDDSEEDDSDDDDDGPWGDDWAELSFAAANIDGYPTLSRAGRRERHHRLLGQRRGQDWVHHLIPDRYHARVEARDGRSGGLVGDLPLLIGLAAMSLPIRRWIDLLPQTIVNHPNTRGSWAITPAQINEVERGSQWTEKRGVVVKVFAAPQLTGMPTLPQDLHNYDQGVFGPILA